MVLCLVAWLVLRECVRQTGNGFVALLLAFLATGASSVHFLARPHILTMLLLAVSMALLRADRRQPSARLWLLVPLMILWTNVHGGFVALVALVGLLVAGTAAESWLSGARRWPEFAAARRYAKLFVAVCAATLVNPYGIGLHRHIAEYLGADWIKKVVDEFQSPSFRSENMYQLEGMILLGVVVATQLIRRRQLVEALWILFWAHQTLISVRHAPLYLILAAPVLAGEVAIWWKALAARMGRKSTFGILDSLSADIVPAFRRTSVWIVAPLLYFVFLSDASNWPADFPAKIFPVKMVNAHAAAIDGQRVFTSDQWADYLIYRFYPRQRVFFDGRSDFYGEKLGRQYQRLSSGEWQWRSILDQYGFRYALLAPDWALASLLKISPDWRILDDNGKAILFERIGPVRDMAAQGSSQFPAGGLMKSSDAAERLREEASR
jgi:hypothetical protein